MTDRISPKMTKTFALVIGHRWEGKEDFRRRISTYLLYSGQKAEEVLGVRRSFFVLKFQKDSVYKVFLAFGLDFLKASVGVFRKIKKHPVNSYRML